jgi:hypothetical protein
MVTKSGDQLIASTSIHMRADIMPGTKRGRMSLYVPFLPKLFKDQRGGNDRAAPLRMQSGKGAKGRSSGGLRNPIYDDEEKMVAGLTFVLLAT